MKNESECNGTRNECFLQSVPCLDAEEETIGLKRLVLDFKATFAKPWNFIVKPWLKLRYKKIKRVLPKSKTAVDITAAAESNVVEEKTTPASNELMPGDWVRVRSKEEIEATLNAFNELKGCAYLSDMYQYCDTIQRVFIRVERFLDERDYKVKSAKGLVYLENLFCTGTPVFGRCDRRCFFFWRVEWLEKLDPESVPLEVIANHGNTASK